MLPIAKQFSYIFAAWRGLFSSPVSIRKGEKLWAFSVTPATQKVRLCDVGH